MHLQERRTNRDVELVVFDSKLESLDREPSSTCATTTAGVLGADFDLDAVAGYVMTLPALSCCRRHLRQAVGPRTLTTLKMPAILWR